MARTKKKKKRKKRKKKPRKALSYTRYCHIRIMQNENARTKLKQANDNEVRMEGDSCHMGKGGKLQQDDFKSTEI